jgi:hypothetical protein
MVQAFILTRSIMRPGVHTATFKAAEQRESVLPAYAHVFGFMRLYGGETLAASISSVDGC